MKNDHAWTGYAASYALGALDVEDGAAFEVHLSDCASCRAEVNSYEEVTGSLAVAAPVRTAPAELRERVLTQARNGRGDHQLIARFQPARTWLALAASLVLCAGAGVLYLRERQLRIATQAASARSLADMIAAQKMLSRADSVLTALLAADAQTTTLAAQGQLPSARLYYSRSRRVVIVAAHDLPPAAAGRTYQLWGIRSGVPVSLGTFNTTAERTAIVSLPLPVSVQFEASAVTEEPAGGSSAPTTVPFLTGSWVSQQTN